MFAITNRNSILRRAARCTTVALLLAAGTPAAWGRQGACCPLNGGTCYLATRLQCRNNLDIPKGFENTPNPCYGIDCGRKRSYAGPPVPIPDGTGNGGSGPEVSVAAFMPEIFPVAGVHAAFYISHTYQGDLKVWLTHVETATTVQLVDRPGTSATPYGFSAHDFGLSPTAKFLCTATADPGAFYDSPGVLPPGIPSGFGEWQPMSPFTPFLGETSVGTWELTVSDCAGGDVGAIIAFTIVLDPPPVSGPCYANCDASTTSPALNVNDFACFLNRYAAGDPYANCDGSTTPPVLNVLDFACFLNRYAAGCS